MYKYIECCIIYRIAAVLYSFGIMLLASRESERQVGARARPYIDAVIN